MIFETAIVIRSEGDALWVKTRRESTCGACHARLGCGQGLFNSSTSADILARLPESMQAQPPASGDRVEIAVADNAVVLGSLLMYGLPIGLLVLGAWYGDSQYGPVWGAGMGLTGLLVGAAAVRRILHSWFNKVFFEPMVVRVLPMISCADQADDSTPISMISPS